MGWSRREITKAAAAIAAMPAFASTIAAAPATRRENRARFPHGVASGDPDDTSVILWTRLEPIDGEGASILLLEVSADETFRHLVARRRVRVGPDADHSCRVLLGGLTPATTYWYRFTDSDGGGSRIGRTCTAPPPDADAAATFAFVSCQNANLGPLTAWRRMIWDDEHAASDERIEFVLHLGDFVYDTIWLPEDRPRYLDRTPRAIVRYRDGERHDDFHVPTSLADYRDLYKAYLTDEDLQNARARWPFVAIWDNGEFSNEGWQGLQRFGHSTRPAQTRKVAANQAWFEFIPSRAKTRAGSLDAFHPPSVSNAPVTAFNDEGLGLEASNLAAIASLVGYRTHRWGRHVELILTDQRSYRSEDYTAPAAAAAIASKTFPQMVPIETLQQIDAGATWDDGRPPSRLQFGDGEVANFRRDSHPRTLLGRTQRRWLLDRLAASTATWKVWANTVATFDMRADPQHLPAGLTTPWPGVGYAGFARTDHSTAYAERGAIMDFVRDRSITGFVTVSGDRHSFWAGYSAKALPPESFEPVGINFVVGSISSPGMVEALEHVLPREHPLRPLFLADRPDLARPEPMVNLLLRHGVHTCLDYLRNRNLEQAVALSDPSNAPHVSFVDMEGHGFAIARASAIGFDVQFTCVPRPIDDTERADGGPIRYRVTHSATSWSVGDVPRLLCTSMVGDAGLSV